MQQGSRPEQGGQPQIRWQQRSDPPEVEPYQRDQEEVSRDLARTGEKIQQQLDRMREEGGGQESGER